MKNKILQIFKSSGLNIISEENLEKYIEFCIVNDCHKRIKGKTSHHHILPKAKNLPFEKYSNLRENPWNGSHLLFKNHYYAHYLLTKSIYHYSIYFSFLQMHNKDTKISRLEKCDLIDFEEVQQTKEYQHKMYETWLNEKVLFEGEEIDNRTMLGILNSRDKNQLVYDENSKCIKKSKLIGIKISQTKNSVEWKETVGVYAVEKMKNTKSTGDYQQNIEPMRKKKHLNSLNRILDNGLTVAQNAGLKTSESLLKINTETGNTIAKDRNIKSAEYRKTTIEDNGLTIAQNSTIRASETMKKVGEDGLTTHERRAKKSSETQRKNGDWYKLCHINGKIINERISKAEVKEISTSLILTTKEKYLGFSVRSKVALNNNRKLHLIGLYLIKI